MSTPLPPSHRRQSTLRPLVLSTVYCLLSTLFLGCTSRGGSITLDSLESNATLTQRFEEAYVTQPKAGEYEIILVDNASIWNYRKTKANKPLQPVPLAPLRQVMHVSMNWKALKGVEDNPAAINAAITWYILGPDGSTDRLVYEGTGFVLLSGSGDKRKLSIRNATLRPTAAQGDLQDPIGPAALTARAVVRPNDTRVRETLTELQQQPAPQN